MSNKTYLGKKVRQFESADRFDSFTRVVIAVSDELKYSAGTETGRTLTLECPWGTQAMADNILTSIQGFRYQPYSASGALLDPAAELGDGVTIHGVYGGIYSNDLSFGPLFTASVSAPHEEEIDHEYPYVPRQERKIERQFADVKATFRIHNDLISAEVTARKTLDEELRGLLSVQAGIIEAKVSKTGGDASAFGWTLNDSSWTIKANKIDILKATKSGLEVNGKITATSGKIGGFDIEPNYLSYNKQTWGGDVDSGIYVGPSGIQLGKNFKVDSAGNLTAASGTFLGNVRAGSIQYGGDYGTLSGSGITGHSITGTQIGYNSISTSYTSSGINTSLGYADFANGVFNGWNTIGSMKVVGLFEFQACKIGRKSQAITTPGGESKTIYYLGWE